MATTKKATTKSNGEAAAAEVDEWEDAREVLIVAGTPVRKPLEEGEQWVGIYLGYVVRKSSQFGPVNMHLMETPEGLVGMWGHHALDEGLKRADVGFKTRVDGRGMLELPSKKSMRLVRVRQLGAFVDTAPVIRDPEAEAAGVYEALGIHGEYVVDGSTGEVLERQAAHEHREGVFEDGAR
jgi:hypothetical protein